jgi:hypothetical protein
VLHARPIGAIAGPHGLVYVFALAQYPSCSIGRSVGLASGDFGRAAATPPFTRTVAQYSELVLVELVEPSSSFVSSSNFWHL